MDFPTFTFDLVLRALSTRTGVQNEVIGDTLIIKIGDIPFFAFHQNQYWIGFFDDLVLSAYGAFGPPRASPSFCMGHDFAPPFWRIPETNSVLVLSGCAMRALKQAERQISIQYDKHCLDRALAC